MEALTKEIKQYLLITVFPNATLQLEFVLILNVVPVAVLKSFVDSNSRTCTKGAKHIA